MFQDYYRDRSPEFLGKEFGAPFALAVAKLPPGSWQGPIESGFGWHLVFVDTVVPGRVPAFEEVEADVRAAWLREQKALAWAKSYKTMRDSYTVLLPGPPEASAAASPRRPRRWRKGPHPRARCRSDAPAPHCRLRLGAAARAARRRCLRRRLTSPGRRIWKSRNRQPGQYTVLWRTPVLAGMRLPLLLSLPEGVTDLKPPVVQELNDSLIERRWIDAGPNGLAGQRIDIKGLQFTITDALVRFEFLDGRTVQTIVRPSQPWVEVAATQTRWQVMGTYVVEGIRHILFGADHLLFVLGLLLLVGNRWMLVKTVTAFTVAHSITLALATLGVADVPALPLNAVIALSILFLGPEIVRVWRGQTSFTIRHPWVVAFAFGLLHGFGFATAMTSAGLPRQDLPLALLSFNIGVELGQLAFVALVLALERAFRVLQVNWPRWVQLLPGYVVGSLGAFWTIQRVAPLIAAWR